MRVVNSPETFQQKMNDLLHGFKCIRVYIYDLLVLTKLYFTYHVQKSELTLNKLKKKGIKCNTENSFFGHTEMEYSSLWVTHDGVKLMDKNKTNKNMKPTTS